MIVSAFQPSSHDSCLVGRGVKAAHCTHIGRSEKDLLWQLNDIVTYIVI